MPDSDICRSGGPIDFKLSQNVLIIVSDAYRKFKTDISSGKGKSFERQGNFMLELVSKDGHCDNITKMDHVIFLKLSLKL